MCTDALRTPCPSGQRGLTLIELIIFIVIVSVGLVGILSVLNLTTRFSADPMVRKQMLAIAEGVMEEVRMQPFTWCDPDDANAATAVNAAGCADPANNDQLKLPLGPTTGETRSSATAPFDNVADYNGSAITTNIAGAALPTGYSATVNLTREALGPAPQASLGAALRIAVTVTRGSDSITLEGYRVRYAPNSLP